MGRNPWQSHAQGEQPSALTSWGEGKSEKDLNRKQTKMQKRTTNTGEAGEASNCSSAAARGTYKDLTKTTAETRHKVNDMQWRQINVWREEDRIVEEVLSAPWEVLQQSRPIVA